ncbi:MAG: toprim domain-containing protein [Nitrosopumilus sp.]|nr:toprim domain-containing protein [Nitrosopumilus sp.]
MNIENKQIAREELNKFILSLNNESNNGSIVIVEGKKDVEALYFIGYEGNIESYHHFRGTTNCVDFCSINYKKLILLLDFDIKGKTITKKILSQINGKFIDLKYKKKLLRITGGRILKIEEIKSFYLYIQKNKHQD